MQEAAKGLQDALGDPSASVLIGCPEPGKVAIVVSLSDGAVKKVGNVTGSKTTSPPCAVAHGRVPQRLPARPLEALHKWSDSSCEGLRLES